MVKVLRGMVNHQINKWFMLMINDGCIMMANVDL